MAIPAASASAKEVGDCKSSNVSDASNVKTPSSVCVMILCQFVSLFRLDRDLMFVDVYCR